MDRSSDLTVSDPCYTFMSLLSKEAFNVKRIVGYLGTKRFHVHLDSLT